MFRRPRCLPQPPSFSGSCFQPLCSPSPRPGLRSGLALFGCGPRRAPLSFVFVLAALLAVRFAAWSLDAGVGVPLFVSEFKGYMLEDAAIALTYFGGHKSESLGTGCETDHIGSKSDSWFAACDFDENGYKLLAISHGSS